MARDSLKMKNFPVFVYARNFFVRIISHADETGPDYEDRSLAKKACRERS